MGSADPSKISTSYVERMNLTLRMGIRPYSRETDANSKRLFQHACAVALAIFYYNFIRPHESLRERYRERTPAMAVGLTDRPWGFADILNLLDAAAPKPNRPAHYRRSTGASPSGSPPSSNASVPTRRGCGSLSLDG